MKNVKKWEYVIENNYFFLFQFIISLLDIKFDLIRNRFP